MSAQVGAQVQAVTGRTGDSTSNTPLLTYGSGGASPAASVLAATVAAASLMMVSSVAAADPKMMPVLFQHDRPSRSDATRLSILQAAPLWRDVLAAVGAEAVEGGVEHPAQSIVSAFARASAPAAVMTAVRELGTRGADFIRLLSRVTTLDAQTRAAIVETALASPDVDVRDAAICAVESWHDRALASRLREHRDAQGWLADYARRIADELDATA